MAQQTDFEIFEGTLEQYLGDEEKVVIPDGVTAIGVDAFRRSYGVVEVVIPDSVQSIGEGAFADCMDLTTINIPDGVISLACVFEGCSSLVNIKLPESVTDLEEAFVDCESLTTLTLPKGVTNTDYTFRGCTSLISVTIPDGVAILGDAIFMDCDSLAFIEIPKSVTAIGNDAFKNCSSLESVKIKGQPSLGMRVFRNCLVLKRVEAPKAWLEDHVDNAEEASDLSADHIVNNPRIGGCYIATAVYGSYDCPQVWVLRRYRDNTLASHMLGRAFIRAYYLLSPHLVKWFGKKQWFTNLSRKMLDRKIATLKARGVKDSAYVD